MTCARTVAALVAGLLVPLVTNAQGANAKPDAASPTAERLPIYEIDRWILKGTRPASSVKPPAQEH